MLTASQDTLVGTGGNDTFSAGVINVNNTLTDSLQSVDSINGGDGSDTLKATINTNAGVTPSLTSIENVELRVTATGGDIDFAGSTGVKNVTVANSTAATGVIDNVGASALAVKNQNTAVNFDHQTGTTLDIAFDAAGVVSSVPANVKEVAVDIGAATASKATTVNITTNNSNVELKDTTGANVATSATIAATGANEVKLTDGLNLTSLTTTGTGSVDVSEVNLVKVATLTAGDGGITFNNGDSTAATFTATTGAGKDKLTVDGANVATISTGAGDDTVIQSTAGLAASSTVNLGAGNDTLTLNNAAAAGATLSAGEGTDTLGVSSANYTTMGNYSAANLAKITGFEVLSISNALGNGTTDVSKIAGIASFTAAAGVTAGATANVTNLGAGSTITIAGDNTLAASASETATFTFADITAAAGETSTVSINGATVTVTAATATAANIAEAFRTGATVGNAVYSGSNDASKYAVTGTTTDAVFTSAVKGNVDDLTATLGGTEVPTGGEVPSVARVQGADAGVLSASLKTDTSADVATLVLNNNFVENNNATANVANLTNAVTANTVETLNVTSTGKASTPFLNAAGNKADGVKNTLDLTDNALVTLNITGDQAFDFTSKAGMSKLATVDGSANTAGVTFSGAAADMSSGTSSVAMNITGSATASNNLTGTGRADTITGGSKADTIKGGEGADALNGGAGNDTFVYGAGTESTLASKDVITGFSANTFGNGAEGAAGTGAGTDATKWTGDVLQFTVSANVKADGVYTFVANNASDAQTFLQNLAADISTAKDNAFGAALDSSTGNLYVDLNSDGTADSVIELSGVSTINEAAFVLA